MNKLEKAIQKSLKSKDQNLSNGSMHFEKADGDLVSDINDISKMQYSFLYTEKELEKKKIIFPRFKKQKLVNSFREIRTGILRNKNRNVILVTSICQNAGTSFFARNLSASIAFDSTKTSVLMNCDINSGGDLDKLYELQDKPGVSTYVNDINIGIDSIIQDSGLKRMRVVPAGMNENLGEEFFSHPRFISLIKELKLRYKDRSIVIDSTSIVHSADTQILLDSCDQVVLVVPYGQGNSADIEAATKIIGKDKFAGVIFNKFIC